MTKLNKIKYNPKQIVKSYNLQLAVIYRIVISLFKAIFQVEDKSIKAIAIIFRKISIIWKTNGLVYTIKYMKAARLHCTRFMVGQPLFLKGNQSVKVAIDKEGFPKIFQGIKYWFTSKSNWDIVKGLTLVTISRGFRRDPTDYLPIDLKSIVEPNQGYLYNLDPKLIRKIISHMNLGGLSIVDQRNQDWKIFNSSGPDGPSTKTCLKTLSSFDDRSFNDLLNLTGPIGKYHLQQARLNSLIHRQLFNPLNFLKPVAKKYIRRIALIEDPELKARIVGIFDHFSQNILNNISKQCFDILKRIPSDRTFSQDPFFNHTGFVENEDKFHSLDLSSATDRFPISLQKQIIEAMGLTKEQSDSWASLLTSHDFQVPLTMDTGYTSVKYAVGQPMGARSSWPIFTLCHHILIRYCAWQIGIKDFHNYIVLGDDVVIKNDQVASMYKSVMYKLGVDLSDTKTHVSASWYEFAKRWIKQGKEVSPIPIHGIVDNIQNLGVIYQIFYELCVERKVFQFNSSFTSGFSKWYSELSKWQFTSTEKCVVYKTNKRSLKLPFFKLRVTGLKSILKRLLPFLFLMRYRTNTCTYDELREFLSKSLVSKSNSNFEYPIPSQEQLLIDVIDTRLKIVFEKLLSRASSQAENIIKTFSVKIDDVTYISSYKDPVHLGLINIRQKLIRVVNENIYEPRKNIKGILDSLLSYDNDLFTNREGSSKTKRRHSFNKLARLLSKGLSDLNVEYGKVPKIEGLKMDFMFGIKLEAGTSFQKKSKDFLFS